MWISENKNCDEHFVVDTIVKTSLFLITRCQKSRTVGSVAGSVHIFYEWNAACIWQYKNERSF